jgi:hypothetical protein
MKLCHVFHEKIFVQGDIITFGLQFGPKKSLLTSLIQFPAAPFDIFVPH